MLPTVVCIISIKTHHSLSLITNNTSYALSLIMWALMPHFDRHLKAMGALMDFFKVMQKSLDIAFKLCFVLLCTCAIACCWLIGRGVSAGLNPHGTTLSTLAQLCQVFSRDEWKRPFETLGSHRYLFNSGE